MSAFRKLGIFSRSHASSTARQQPRARLRAESLEDRTVPANFTVSNLDDAGAGSLRQAVQDANDTPGADTITFTGAGASGTITLTSGEIAITDSLTITGPGASALTISGNKASRIFNIGDTDFLLNVTVDGLTFTDGSGDTGGAISAAHDENLTIRNATFTGNTATLDGGAVALDGGSINIQNSIFTGNTADLDGGAVFTTCATAVVVNQSQFSKNSSTFGNGGAIAISCNDGSVLIQNSEIMGNTAGNGGGGLGFQGLTPTSTLRIDQTTISDNTAGASGGGIDAAGIGGTVDIVDSAISGNTAAGDGGGLIFHTNSPAAAINIERTKITGNTANGDDGGGVFFSVGIGAIRISESTISGNTVTNGDGGGVSLYNNYNGYLGIALSFTVEHSDISGNTASESGGGIFFYLGGGFAGSLAVKDSKISGNTAGGDGGGVFFYVAGPVFGTFAITNSEISNNTITQESEGSGGGIHVELGVGMLSPLVIQGSTISGNTAPGDGGGVFLEADGGGFYGGIQVSDSTISGNTSGSSGGGIFLYSSGSGGSGGSGGLYSASSLRLQNSTISGNVADGDGGGISFYMYFGSLILQNSTVSGNSSTNGSGGGIMLDQAYNPTFIQNSTIAFNSAANGSGGGIYADDTSSGGTIIQSSIISGNTASEGNDLAGASDSTFYAQFSLIGDSTIGGDATFVDLGSNLLDVDPLLGPLQNNGGPTQTHALLTNSPALNAGSNISATTTDQRGAPFLRTFGPATDIGAVESQTFPSSVTLTTDTATVTNTGSVTLTATVPALDNVPTPTGTVTFVDTTTGATLGTATLVNGVATLTVTGSLLAVGANNIVANYAGDGNFDPSASAPITVTRTTTPVPPEPPAASGSAYGAGSGAGVTQLLAPDGSVQLSLAPFGPDFTGGVRVATGDFNSDGILDLVVTAGPGLPPIVQVIDGKNGNILFGVAPFESSFTGGAYVTAGDITGDGVPELVVTPDLTGGPRVIVYSPAASGGFVKIADFFGITDPDFRGGARAAVADINNDGFGDLVVSAGFGGGPRVAIWNGKFIQTGVEPTKLVDDFYVFEDTLRNGVFVSGADVDGDGFADLIAGAGPGGSPRVLVLNGQDLLQGTQTTVSSFFAGDSGQRNGVPVAVADFDGDGALDLLTGIGEPIPGTNGLAAPVTVYTVASLANSAPTPLTTVDPFPGFAGGVFVG